MLARVIGIRSQLALLVGSFLALALLGLAFFVAAEDRREKLEHARDHADQVLEAMALSVATELEAGDVPSMKVQLRALADDERGPDFVEVAVADPQGRLVADSGEPFPDPAFLTRAVAADEVLMEQRGRDVFLSVPSVHGERRGTVVARVSLSRTEGAVVESTARIFIGAGVLAALSALALFVGLSLMVVRPLRALRQKAARLGQMELHERVQPHGGKELRELAETLNGMAAALQRSHDELEQQVEARTRELREANTKLERMAVTDGLTGVFNHRRFQEELVQEVLRADRSGRPLSVLMIDVDLFKRFNDRFGHPAGDRLLKELATALQAELRATDILARYGGEEFAIILPETDEELAAQVAERLRAAVDTQVSAGEPDKHVSISVGVATRRKRETAQELVAAADRALYRAKDAGRNRVVAA